jgi:hypothetical protein
MDRLYNFEHVDRVRMGTGFARITSVTPQRVEYTDEAGSAWFVDLDECARIGSCLEHAGLFPPSDDLDWAAVATVGSRGSESAATSSGCVGLRGALDEPAWFQFLDQRRTQFEFTDGRALYAELLTPMARMTFDAC